MTTAEQAYIHSLEEPDEVLHGNGKRFTNMVTIGDRTYFRPDTRKRIADVQQPVARITEEEDNRRQYEYLRSKGIPC